MKPAPAIFIGVQEGFGPIPAQELYNLLTNVGTHPAGSTVTRQTLERHGYAVPRPLLHKRVA